MKIAKKMLMSKFNLNMKNKLLFNIFFFSVIIASGQTYNEYDSEGKRHGKWKKMYENTNLIRYEGTFDHGKEVGEFKFYKKISEQFPTAIKFFSKDSDTVVVKYYTLKGKVISEGKMVDKERVGLWKYYHQNSSKLMMTEQYKSGKLNGEQLTYFESGQLTEKCIYKEGKKEGKRIVYSEGGIVIKEFTYVNDQLHGLTKYYELSGKLKIEGSYKKDRKDGIWSYYNEGKLLEKKKFPLSKKDKSK